MNEGSYCNLCCDLIIKESEFLKWVLKEGMFLSRNSKIILTSLSAFWTNTEYCYDVIQFCILPRFVGLCEFQKTHTNTHTQAPNFKNTQIKIFFH